MSGRLVLLWESAGGGTFRKSIFVLRFMYMVDRLLDRHYERLRLRFWVRLPDRDSETYAEALEYLAAPATLREGDDGG